MATRRRFIGAATAAGAASLLGSVPGAAYADTAATDAERERQARDAIRAVNADMRRNYAALKADLTTRLGPVVIVQNDARGGLYTLVHQGEQESLHPVAETFELAKSIAHVPLGLFSVLAPYLSSRVPAAHSADIDPHDLAMVAAKGPRDEGWIPPLQDFSRTLDTARARLQDAHLPKDLEGSCAKILDRAHEFIANATRTRSFDMKSFEDFSGGVYPNVRTNMYFASKAQIEGVGDLMTRWRRKLGEDAWRGLYVVVLSIWTTSVLNQNSIIIKNYMDPAKVDTHLIDLATAELPADPVHVALDNLARIVQDNIAAEMVFSTDQEVADALKGKQDLLSEEILRLLGGTGANSVAGANQLVCPFRNKTAGGTTVMA
ncbi:hypothetical protein JK359_03915 [Streptomyces actinomycinicus]|uniref:Twin-arginine translocation signal domain-containing protein n=1 Tax=Streptomyces actinomycinicus TaxID=1695166 RepID=A0A937EEL4_9ACTN|nr:hypothetical protein [Streptomyces actinomycinicus]MBL1081128.1 hypothetical protein [Streptomyces actinomycinicus]